MDWVAFWLSIKLGLVTVALLMPIGLLFGRWLAYGRFAGKGFVEAALALPLVLPPTVVGYYLLVSVGGATPSVSSGNRSLATISSSRSRGWYLPR